MVVTDEVREGVKNEARLRVLLVDDDAELCELVEQYLTARHFVVDIAGSGESALQQIQSQDYALLVLDIMLPGIDGLEVLRRLRTSEGHNAHLPVVMLTAQGDEVDRIVGLELGADDYLPKPFNPRELLARMRAILRRASEQREQTAREKTSREPAIAEHSVFTPPAPVIVQMGDVVMDVGARSVRRAGEEIELTAIEFDLLHALLCAAGHVVERDALANDVLHRTLMPLERSLDMHMSKLRRKLGPRPDGSERIKTVRGIGYIYTREAKL